MNNNSNEKGNKLRLKIKEIFININRISNNSKKYKSEASSNINNSKHLFSSNYDISIKQKYIFKKNNENCFNLNSIKKIPFKRNEMNKINEIYIKTNINTINLS